MPLWVRSCSLMMLGRSARATISNRRVASIALSSCTSAPCSICMSALSVPSTLACAVTAGVAAMARIANRGFSATATVGGDCAADGATKAVAAINALVPTMPATRSAKRTGRQTERVMLFMGGALWQQKSYLRGAIYGSKPGPGNDPRKSSGNWR